MPAWPAQIWLLILELKLSVAWKGTAHAVFYSEGSLVKRLCVSHGSNETCVENVGNIFQITKFMSLVFNGFMHNIESIEKLETFGSGMCITITFICCRVLAILCTEVSRSVFCS